MASTPRVLVLTTGDPVPAAEAEWGNFDKMIQQAAGVEHSCWHWREQDLREQPSSLVPADAVIVTGSPASVTERLPWMLRAEAHLRQLIARDVPVLGICFGHQLVASALGGLVAVNPRGREMGTVRLQLTATSEVFGGPHDVAVNASHVDSVVELPQGAKVFGATELEPHAAVIFQPKVWGVQFHPEFRGRAMAQYLHARSEILRSEGFDVEHGVATVEDTPVSAQIVERFLVASRPAVNG